jgi:cation transport ATPase
VRFATETDAAEWQPKQNPAQFTLRQMFGWTLAVAMIAWLARFVARSDDFRPGTLRDLLMIVAVCLAGGAIAYGAVWAALGRGSPPLRLLVVAAVAGLSAHLVFSLFNAHSREGFLFISWPVLDVLLTGCALLLFRGIGFRLVRASRGGRTTKNAE